MKNKRGLGAVMIDLLSAKLRVLHVSFRGYGLYRTPCIWLWVFRKIGLAEERMG